MKNVTFNGLVNGAVVAASVAALMMVPTGAQAAGGQVTSAASPVQSTTLITLIVPSVIGIDIETDINFDMGAYAAAAAPNSCRNVFPVGSACTTANWQPTSVTHVAAATPVPIFTAPTTVAGEGAIYMSLLDTATAATSSVTVTVPATWSGGNPGISTTAIQTKVATTNNNTISGSTIGDAGYTSITTTAGSGATRTLNTGGTFGTHTPFNWTRVDQSIQLGVTFSATEFLRATGGTNATATLTYAFNRT